MAEALHARGLGVTVVEQLPQVLPAVDAELAALVEEELARHGVLVRAGVAVRGIERTRNGPVISGDGLSATADLILVVVGVRPDAALAKAAGIELGVRGAIAVDRRMHTNIEHIYAAGDCVHTYHRLLDLDTYLPLGTTAHKQGRVAGENAAGGDREFAGSLGTQVVKVFDLAVARTGLRDHEATAHGLAPDADAGGSQRCSAAGRAAGTSASAIPAAPVVGVRAGGSTLPLRRGVEAGRRAQGGPPDGCGGVFPR